ncbi:MAG: MarR family transcriptional regulator [Pseudomonadota bacterium]
MANTETAKNDTGSVDLDGYRYGCVAFNLRRASRIVTRRYEEALRSLDMKAFQFTTLAALSTANTLPQRTIAKLFGMDPSTANRNIRAMTKKGWVEYTDDPNDGRKKHVSLTRAGREAFQKAVPFWEAAQRESRALMRDYSWKDELSWLFAISGEDPV